jgi:hypothetical protein
VAVLTGVPVAVGTTELVEVYTGVFVFAATGELVDVPCGVPEGLADMVAEGVGDRKGVDELVCVAMAVLVKV